MANQIIKLLRNSSATTYTTLDAAKSGLNTALEKIGDGAVGIARYKDSAHNNKRKTILGVYDAGITADTKTVFFPDVDEDAIKALIATAKTEAINSANTNTKNLVGTLPQGFKNVVEFVQQQVAATKKAGVTGVTAGTGEKYISVVSTSGETGTTVAISSSKDLKNAIGSATTAIQTATTLNDGLISVTVDKQGETPSIKIDAGTSLTGAVDKANSAVQSVTCDSFITAARDSANTVTLKVQTGTTTGTTDPTGLATAADVKSNINKLENNSKVTISSTATTEGYLKSYTFTQNNKTIGTIDIPKDLVVSKGRVVTAVENPDTSTESTQVKAEGTTLINGTKYLELTIANQKKPVYIAVKDLVDVYTGDGKTINVASNNTINVITVAPSGATTSGLVADAKLIKDYVDGKEINATGDKDYIEVSGGTYSVTVHAAEKVRNAVSKAETSIQSVSKGTNETLISVSTSASTNAVVISSTNNLTNAVKNANSAVQSVNGISGTVVTIAASNIKTGEIKTATTATTAITTTEDTVATAISKLYAVAAKYKGTTTIKVADNGEISGAYSGDGKTIKVDGATISGLYQGGDKSINISGNSITVDTIDCGTY